jgi:hypothetical protein
MKPRLAVITNVNVPPSNVIYTKTKERHAAVVSSKVIHVIVALFLCSWVSSASTLVVIRFGNSVVVAADSRRTQVSTGQVISDSVCKIQEIGPNRFLAAVGATEILETIDTRAASERAGSIGQLAADIEVRLKPVIARTSAEVAQAKLTDPDIYAAYMGESTLLTYVILGTVGQGNYGWAMRDFSARDIVNGNDPIRNNCPPNCLTRTPIILAGSQKEAANLARGTSVWRNGFVAAAEELVRAQIRTDPKRVGGSISVLLLTGNGAQWIKRGACISDQRENREKSR